MAPQQHGLFEYFLYLKEADAIINTLTFEEMGATHRNTLTDKGLHPKMLFDGTTIHEALIESGVKTFTHILTSYAFSHCARQLFDGSTIVPSLRSSDLIVTLRKNLEQQAGPAYFFVHLSNLDTLAHQYGPRSYEYNTELSVISGLLQRELVEKIDPKTAKETLLLVTADHGGVTVDPKKTVHLNNFSELLANMKYGKDGTQVLCTGSPRDVFLHVQEDKVSETKELLTRKVGSRAKVFEIKEALSAGLFGQGEVSSKFLERAGDLLIIPCRSETVWFEHFLDRQFNPLGQHGGLHEDEMVVPLSVAPLSDLK